jgi:hypothetical protein
MSSDHKLDAVFARWFPGIEPRFTRQQYNRAERRAVRQVLRWNFTPTCSP